MDHTIPPPDEEELVLSKLVFGDNSDFYNELQNINLELSSEEDAAEYEQNSDSEHSESDNEIGKVMDDQLFFVDDGEQNADDEDAMDIDDENEQASWSDYSNESEENESDAWIDSDDDRLQITVTENNRSKKLRKSHVESQINGREYVQRLRSQFEKIYPKPNWVEDEDDSEIDNDSENEGGDYDNVIDGDINALTKILERTYNYTAANSKLLPPKALDITRLKDANASHPSHSAIQSLSFHSTKPILLTGGYDRTLRIYHIDGKANHLITSVHIKGTPVQTCSFYSSQDGKEQKVYTGGRRRYMHAWDLSNNNTSVAKIDKISRLYGHQDTQRSFEKFKLAHFQDANGTRHGLICLQGNNGWVNILHSSTGVWLQGCKIEGAISDFCIDYKPQQNDHFHTILIATNTYGEVWEFNLNENGKTVRRWKDDGGVGITKIQVGGGSTISLSKKRIIPNRWIAIGSDSGFVNVYDRQSDSQRPVFTLDQLTTSISSIEFSPDGQMLCIASRATKDALRLVHLATGTVFSNWPTSGTPLGKVTSVAFSPQGEMLAVGNEQGKVRLWRLNHY
ncbi:Utp18 [Kluyveromyces lactis]|nr:Utp18 [Kluyveromyces lactis]